jgi:1-deoxy-D-xylulose-5-phosphate reductoisomerase
MQKIAILGSTGSIGQSALNVIEHFPDRFRVVGLSANSNVELLEKQIKDFHPLFVGVRDASASKSIKKRISPKIKLFTGEEGLEFLVREKEVEKILLAISGSGALCPLLKAIENKKQIALANKEALVMAGPIIMKEALKKKANIIPVDSEQSAIWQCLDKAGAHKLKNIYLTASGGPFRQAKKNDLKSIKLKQVLNHPRWKMGKKVTVDSATMMNKGLEFMEAMFLFDMPYNGIKVLIHPQAIVHSMVEFIDGVILAQLSATDMRIPIQYALSYPERLPSSLPSLDFCKLRELEFYAPDLGKFPCLKLAFLAARELGTMPAVLNAANEISVHEFLKGKLSFILIPTVIEKVMNSHRNRKDCSLKEILDADSWARQEAYKIIDRLN